ncbi:hypothetical protein ACLQ2Q_20730 [Microbacterium sp. DT81.1]|uniref:hypothetical protein n=1 Tax=Microbacterium sp. DT81.1 TaxID=3393413 RepID=UPI003CF4FF09
MFDDTMDRFRLIGIAWRVKVYKVLEGGLKPVRVKLIPFEVYGPQPVADHHRATHQICGVHSLGRRLLSLVELLDPIRHA